MERLTERFDWCVVRKGCHGPCRTCNGVECADIHPMIERLAAYEDTGLEPSEIMALIDPPNPPLTLEELREMDGEPVYFYFGSGFGEWALVLAKSELYDEVSLRNRNGLPSPARFVLESGGNIYRRKPEDVT